MKPEAAAFLSSLSSSAASPSSSSRREHRDAAPAADSSDSPGCMAGILRIVSRYHNSRRRRRRFLTFRRPSAAATIAGDHKQSKTSDTAKSKPRPACEVPRSPTIPAEIRRSSSEPPSPAPGGWNNNPNHNTTRQALVARLMGLDEGGGGDVGVVAAEQRRKLLGALEKCDEDLKALKEMIDEVKKSVGSKVGDDRSAGDCGSDGAPAAGNNNYKEAELEEDPSGNRLPPLTEFTRPNNHYHRRHHHQKSHAPCTGGAGGGGIPRQQKKKPGDHEEGIFFFDVSTKRSPVAAAATVGHHHPNPSTTMESLLFPCRSRQRWSYNDNNAASEKKAMAESVERACSDIAWGQKREVGRIGLALQDHICKDLVEELVKEVFGHYLMNKYYKYYYDNTKVFHEYNKHSSCDMINTLPFDACKRSLRF